MKKLYFTLIILLISVGSFGQTVFINEIHYDNDGGDTNEGVEIAGPAGTDLSTYTIIAYNGSTGASYDTTSLSGTIPNQGGTGFGTAWFAISGLQNGSPDGLALYNGVTFIQFLSYEGTFTATDGLASGLTSVDIGVSESGSSTIGHSLQLTGTGTTYTDFTWSGSAANTNGAINTGQTFSGSSCGVTLGTATYTCATNTTGADNDNVTINIPYTGVDAGITSVTTTSGGTTGGDNPASVSNGTITITGLGEGDAWDITLNGGDCDGTTLSGTVPSTECDPITLIINEIHADPDATNGDANGDGSVSTTDDEFVEIYNSSGSSIDLENYTLSDGFGVRHTFPAGTILPANGFITVFGGGTPTGINGISQTASLGLNNGGDTVTLRNSGGATIVEYIYGSEGGDNQSIGRNPDFSGSFVKHSTIAGNGGALFSPGAKNDGSVLSVVKNQIPEFKLYPNPVSNKKLFISTKQKGNLKVQIYSIIGQQLYNKEVTVNEPIDISEISNGIYFIRVEENGKIATRKLIVR